jgi:drug/metabolite transporter (DMT)-like permease
MNRTLTGTLLALASAGGYAFFSIFTKLAYTAGVTVFDVLTWRFILAAGLLWLAFPLWRRQLKLRLLTRQDVVALLVMGILFAFAAWVAFLSLARVHATTYTMLFYAYPTMVALISLLLGERLPLTSWIAVGLALAGCALAAGAEIVVDNLWDISLPLINGATIALYTIVAERWAKNVAGLTSGYVVITLSFAIFVIAAAFHGLGLPPTLAGWGALLGLSVLSTIVGIVALLASITYIGASRSALVSTVGPPVTVFLAAVLLGEKIDEIQYVGGLLILASMVLLQLNHRGAVLSMEPEVPSLPREDAP